MTAADIEFIRLVYNTSPLLAIALGALGLWYILSKVGFISGLKVSDDHVGKAVEDINDRVAKLEDKDLHGRMSKIEGYLEGRK